MKMRIAVVAAFIAMFVHIPQTVNGQGETRGLQGIFFGGSAGVGGARIDHPEMSPGIRGGGLASLTFGWVSHRWVIGGEFTSWGTSILGIPVHLHTIGPRIEFTPGGREGPFVGGTAGLALTEGEIRARAGAAAAAFAGYKWLLMPEVTLSMELGAHGHLYREGSALFPFTAVHLRFYGSTVPLPK